MCICTFVDIFAMLDNAPVIEGIERQLDLKPYQTGYYGEVTYSVRDMWDAGPLIQYIDDLRGVRARGSLGEGREVFWIVFDEPLYTHWIMDIVLNCDRLIASGLIMELMAWRQHEMTSS